MGAGSAGVGVHEPTTDQEGGDVVNQQFPRDLWKEGVHSPFVSGSNCSGRFQ